MRSYTITALWCILSIIVVISAQNSTNQQVHVTVYYESLCPDSKKFINNQLHPALTKNNSHLADHVNLILVPFGKAQFNFDKKYNEYAFSCHHGADECTGNKIHACGLEKINGGKDANGFVSRIALDFVDCLMKNVDRSQTPNAFPTIRCATDSQVGNLAEVDNCSKHVDGQKYLANFGTKTHELIPELKSVPTVVFNDVHKPEESEEAQKDLVKVICRYLRKMEVDLPVECNATGAASSLISYRTGVVFLVIMVLLHARL